MKNKIMLMLCLISVSVAFAQQGINYKALIKDGSGNVVASQVVTVQFIIYEGVALANNVYQETHTPTTDANGIIIINIGEGSINSGVFTNIDWANDGHFLNVQINTGAGLTDMGTAQFKTVPYALSAANVATKINELSDGKSDANGSSLFLGVDAGLNDNGTDNQNVGIGLNALKNNTTGSNNTAIGRSAGNTNSVGSANVFIGFASGYNETGNGKLYIENSIADADNALIYGEFGLDNSTSGHILRTNSEFQIGNPTGTGYSFPSIDGSVNQVLQTDGTGSLSWVNNSSLGSQKIDDLSDGKSDANGSSIFIGIDAGLNDNGGNNQNVGIGFNALSNSTSGNSNTANGALALYSNTYGSNNTAIGRSALYSNTTGNFNTAIGTVALEYNTGSGNTAYGSETLWSNISGNFNTANGASALYFNTTGSTNTANGFGAGLNNISGSGNIFLGYESGYNETNSNTLYIENSNANADNALIYGEFDTNILRTNSEFQIGNPTGTGYSFPSIDGSVNQVLQTDGTGSLSWVNNSSLGSQKINDLSDGKSNANGSSLFLGVDAGLNDEGGDNDNLGVGFNALYSNTTGYNNTANGSLALYSNTRGFRNTANGYRSLIENTTGSYNTANGHQALSSNTTGNNNTANGYQALYSNTASNNTANGYQALYNNTTGIENTAVGYSALSSTTTGKRNTATGYRALFTNTTGEFNTAVGTDALFTNSASYNTAIGRSALFDNTSGTNNTATGYVALSNNTTGGYNTAYGRDALSGNTTGSNNTAVGYNAQVPSATNSNQVQIGDTNVTYAGVQVAWTVTSDKRWKENIRELPYGLDFVKQLKPVDYVRKNNEHKTRETGFIAQDIEVLLAEIGYTDQGILTKDDNGYMSLRYNDFIAILTKAIQEQQETIESLQSESENQKATISNLTSELEPLQQRLLKIEQLLNVSDKIVKTSN